MSPAQNLTLPSLDDDGDIAFGGPLTGREDATPRRPADLGQIYDVPVQVSAVLGRARLPVGDLLRIGPGTVLELDRRVGEAVDILVNDRLVARSEVVLVDERLGVTMTEIVRPAR